jgi:hypothetical protein
MGNSNKDDLANFFGEDFAKEITKSSTLVKEYEYPSVSIPQKDAPDKIIYNDPSDNIPYFQKVACELLLENMNGELKEFGYVTLDEAFLRTKNEMNLKIRKFVKTDKPFESNKIFILQIGCKDGKPMFLEEKDGFTPNIMLRWRYFGNKQFNDPSYPTISLKTNLGPVCLEKIKSLMDAANVPEGPNKVVPNNAVWILGIGKDIKNESYIAKKDSTKIKKGETGYILKFSLEAIIPFRS